MMEPLLIALVLIAVATYTLFHIHLTSEIDPFTVSNEQNIRDIDELNKTLAALKYSFKELLSARDASLAYEINNAFKEPEVDTLKPTGSVTIKSSPMKAVDTSKKKRAVVFTMDSIEACEY
jgi:hypothetical protein